jgi:hypothetical protein
LISNEDIRRQSSLKQEVPSNLNPHFHSFDHKNGKKLEESESEMNLLSKRFEPGSPETHNGVNGGHWGNIVGENRENDQDWYKKC